MTERRGVLLFFIGILFVLCLGLMWAGNLTFLGRLQQSEEQIYDLSLKSLPHVAPDPRIVIVAMDDQSLEKMGRPFYPLPRTDHARLVEKLTKAGAKVIAFDVMFGKERPTEDPVFVAALQKQNQQGKVVSALITDIETEHQREIVSFSPPATSLRSHLLSGSILVPQPLRTINLFRTDDKQIGKRWPHLCAMAVAAYYEEEEQTPTQDQEFHWGTHIHAPTDSASNLRIPYIGPEGTFPLVSYADVVDGTWQKDHSMNFFRGKIVFVGRQSTLEDMHQTPYGPMAGVEALANATQALLTNRYIYQPGIYVTALAAFLSGLLFLLVVWRRGVIWGLIIALLLGLLWWGGTHFLFITQRLFLPPLTPLVLLGGICLLVTLYEAARAQRAFRQFLPSWVMQQAISGQGGQMMQDREVTVVFCDIRGFTAYTELHSAPEVIAMLNQYFAAGDVAARRQSTELDKFIGDAMMLYFFDLPGKEPHPVRALRWATEMQEKTALMGISIGMGIATGVASEGLIGAGRRLQPTVIGDVVNVASRLQDFTRDGPSIVMNSTTAEAVENTFSLEPLGELSVRGKQKTVNAFTLKP